MKTPIVSGIIAVSLLGTVCSFKIILEEPEALSEPENSTAVQSPLQNEEFQRWLQVQGERTVQKIMDKISSPNDTSMQHEAKVAVARYLVNLTFTAMTRRLEKYGKSIPETAYRLVNLTTTVSTAEDAETTIPTTEVTSELSPVMILVEAEQYAENSTEALTESELVVGETTGIIEEDTTVIVQEGTTIIVRETTTISGPAVPQKQPLPIGELVHPASSSNQSPQPASLPNTASIPASLSNPSIFQVSSSVQAAAPELGSAVSPFSPIFAFKDTENKTVPASSTDNQTESSTTARPIWQQILSFNFSALGSGGGFNLSSLSGGAPAFNLSSLGGGARLPFNFSLTGLGGVGEGGSRLPFNLSLSGLGGGGEGGSRLPFNISLAALRGESGGGLPFNLSLSGASRLPFNFSLPSLGGGGDGAAPFNLSLAALRGQGGSRIPFNFTLPLGGGVGIGLVTLNNTSTNSTGEGSGLPFNFPAPPEGLFNVPTPPPMNDSVRLAQMNLGSQVEKLVDGINMQNLTGIVDSTVSIATPSTVGVLVNALLNLVLCNPLDRWNGNCGI